MNEIYQPPKSDLNQEGDIPEPTYKRPRLLTFLCLFGGFGGLASIPLIFSQQAQSIGVWYPPYLGLSVLVGLLCFIGIWKMKKIAAHTYIAFTLINQPIMLIMGIWNLFAILMPGLFIAALLFHIKKMR